MIERVLIQGYRRFVRLDFVPNTGMNIVVGDNESGKSTLLEAIALALTGKVNGRWANEELNPFWFHRATVLKFFEHYGTDAAKPAPEISIELFFRNDVDALQGLRGVNNSQRTDCPGVALRVSPSEDYGAEFREYMDSDPPTVLPVEFYATDWRDFADNPLVRRPRELATSFIDSRTIRSTSGVDFHTREMLSEHLDAKERAQISLAHRRSWQGITDGTLAGINTRISADNADLHHNPIGLQMDQSARTSWETGIVPQVSDIPFAMAGQGQQAAIKVALAMSRTSGAKTFVLIEEPENHLSHTSLSRLITRIEALAADDQQLFISTHSSFVLNRLGVDRLILLHGGGASKLGALDDSTVSYFRRLPGGYDTLRLVLAEKLALVEGPSDEIVFQRAYRDATGVLPAGHGIDIVSMGGLTFRRALELCTALDRNAAALRDNDGTDPDAVRTSVAGLLAEGKREMFVGDPARGHTLEPQVADFNADDVMRPILGITEQANVVTWMTNNKTDAALRILDSAESITMPDYINEAVAFLR